MGSRSSNIHSNLTRTLSFQYVDSYPSAGIQAALQVFRRLAELQMDKDKDNKSFMIGCLLGKGGSIVSEMRKATKANIRISPKDEHSKCAEENDELVQVICFEILLYTCKLAGWKFSFETDRHSLVFLPKCLFCHIKPWRKVYSVK